MKPVKINGFTIVETMLFLAITGLLIMGVLVGTSTSINVQRYRDSVTSLQSYLQLQYSNVANVSNDTTTNTCNSPDSTPRGQSGCVILGKYITISPDGTTINTQDVLGSDISDTTDVSNDLTALADSNISTNSVDVETYTLEWGASVHYPGSGSAATLYMLILRSPTSGVIRTFVSKTPPQNNLLSNILSDTTLSQSASAQLCVDSNGLLTGTTMAVKIDGNSTSASGVEIMGDGNGC
jgi:type II secretory pathway pseudopilin PulG